MHDWWEDITSNRTGKMYTKPVTICAPYQIRTDDIFGVNEALYQLS